MPTLPGTDYPANRRTEARTDRPYWRTFLPDYTATYIDPLKAKGWEQIGRYRLADRVIAGRTVRGVEVDFAISRRGSPITVTEGRRTRTYVNQAAYDYLEPQVQKCLPKPKARKAARPTCPACQYPIDGHSACRACGIEVAA